MPAATIYAVLTAAAMIGWNVVVTEGREKRPHRPYSRPRSKRRFRRFGRRHRQQRRDKWSSAEQASSSSPTSSSSSSSSSSTTAAATTTTATAACTRTPPRHLQRQKQHQLQQRRQQERKRTAREGEPASYAAAAACRPCGTPVTAPASADRCPVSPAAAVAVAAGTPSSSPPVEFQDLVLILDAPAMSPPPWKLPNLPEEVIDAAVTDNLVDPNQSPSPPSPSAGGCDLSPGFHLSAPWSPLGRRNSWGRNSGGGGGNSRHRRRSAPLGNRPRTFSEYSAAESCESGSSSQAPPPLLRERPARSASAGAGAGLWSATATATAAAWGGWKERRARSYTCGSHAAIGDGGSGHRGPFADWSVDRQDEEATSRRSSSGARGGNGGVRGGNGGIRFTSGGGGGRDDDDGSDDDDDRSDSDSDGGARWCPEESLVLLRNMSIARNVGGKGVTVAKGRAAMPAATCGNSAVNAGDGDDDLAFRTGRGSSSESSTVSNDSSSSGGGGGGAAAAADGGVVNRVGRIRPPLGARSRHPAGRVLRAW